MVEMGLVHWLAQQVSTDPMRSWTLPDANLLECTVHVVLCVGEEETISCQWVKTVTMPLALSHIKTAPILVR